MKMFFCLMVTMMLFTCACAESVPSKTTSNMTQIEIVTDAAADTESSPFISSVQTDDGEKAAFLEATAAEIQKLTISSTVEEYFGEIKDAAGNAVSLKEMLGVEELNCFEFCPIMAGGFEQQENDTTVKLQFSTPYAAGAQVLVLIGIATETGIDWTAYPAYVDEAGHVITALDNQMILQIQANMAMMAIVSK